MDVRTLQWPDDAPPIRYTAPKTHITFTLWLEFEWWEPEPDDDPELNFFNMRVDCSDGHAYALNVWTFRYLDHVRQEATQTGESLSGTYLVPPDLLVQRLERDHIATVVADMIMSRGLASEWLVPSEDERR